MPTQSTLPLRVVSVFTGAGGLDVGLHRAGAQTVAMCESWEPARRVLKARFPSVHVADNVETFRPTMPYEVLAAGFPCTDLSHAGGKAGIFGAQSGLVEHVFQIAAATSPEWIVLENVPNLLHLHRGLGIRTVTTRLEELGYNWAYRLLDSRFTGVPQRRNRVILMASRVHDPASVLLAQDLEGPREGPNTEDRAWGFYWTEGRTGLGLVQGAVPTLKGGSTIGIPSAPAVWVPDEQPGRRLLLPPVWAGEVLQGFERGWTQDAVVAGEHDHRWKLIGNAVTTGVGEWIGRRLLLHRENDAHDHVVGAPLVSDLRSWPNAAFGGPDSPAVQSPAGRWPQVGPRQSLEALVDETWTPLSHRATKGFLSRVDEVGRELSSDFLDDVVEHLGWAPRAVQRNPNTADIVASELRRRRFKVTRETYLAPGVRHRPDVAVESRKIAVHLRACFWHGCPHHAPEHLAQNPRWTAKRDRTMARDRDLVESLTALGWLVVVAWGHDSPDAIVDTMLVHASDRKDPAQRVGWVIGEEVLDEVPAASEGSLRELVG